MKNVFIFLIVIVIVSCNKSSSIVQTNNSNKSFIIQKSMAKFLVESTDYIKTNTLITDSSKFFFNSFSALYIHDLDSFKLDLDSIKVTIVNDTIIDFSQLKSMNDSITLKEVVLPNYNGNLSLDSLNVVVKCLFSEFNHDIGKTTEVKCIFANYLIRNNEIYIKKGHEKCN